MPQKIFEKSFAASEDPRLNRDAVFHLLRSCLGSWVCQKVCHIQHYNSTIFFTRATVLCLAGTGHFHLLIDAEDFIEETTAIPFDDAHRHYGKGQTSIDLELPSGSHKLTLQFANALHLSYGPEYAQTVLVSVPWWCNVRIDYRLIHVNSSSAFM